MSDDPEDTQSDATLVRRPSDATLRKGGEVVHALLVPTETGPPQRVKLGPLAIVIGRQAPADLVIGQAEVSRRHAEVSLVDGAAQVRDLGSTNGTYVNGARIEGTVKLAPGDHVRVGSAVLEYEARGERGLAEEAALDADIQRAWDYVAAILPTPLREGPVRAEHHYLPSARLGGDAFGYQMIAPGVFAGYLLDVTGHGVGSAMHAVSLANVLRQPGLLGADLTKPADVVFRLNNAFPMEKQGGLLFSIWYWAYDVNARTLEYCSGGHHPAIMVRPDGSVGLLEHNNPVVGAMEDIPYRAATVDVAPGSRLYMFSDGAFEIKDMAGRDWTHGDIVDLVRAMPDGALDAEPGRLYAAVRRAARPGPLEDDFSLLVFAFG